MHDGRGVAAGDGPQDLVLETEVLPQPDEVVDPPKIRPQPGAFHPSRECRGNTKWMPELVPQIWSLNPIS